MQHIFDYLEDICNRDDQAVQELFDTWQYDKTSFFGDFQQVRLVHQDCLDCTITKDLVLLALKNGQLPFLKDVMMACDSFLPPEQMRSLFRETFFDPLNTKFSSQNSLLSSLEITSCYLDFLPHQLQALSDISDYLANNGKKGPFKYGMRIDGPFGLYDDQHSARLPLALLKFFAKRTQHEQAQHIFSQLTFSYFEAQEHKNKENFRQFDEGLACLAFHPDCCVVKDMMMALASGEQGATFAFLLPQSHNIIVKENILSALEDGGPHTNQPQRKM